MRESGDGAAPDPLIATGRCRLDQLIILARFEGGRNEWKSYPP